MGFKRPPHRHSHAKYGSRVAHTVNHMIIFNTVHLQLPERKTKFNVLREREREGGGGGGGGRRGEREERASERGEGGERGGGAGILTYPVQQTSSVHSCHRRQEK